MFQLYIYIGQITREESLFHYPGSRRKRQTYEDFINPLFVPLFRDELNFTAEQTLACEGNDQCLFDLAVTGDMEFAENTLNHEKNVSDISEDLGKLIIHKICRTRL